MITAPAVGPARPEAASGASGLAGNGLDPVALTLARRLRSKREVNRAVVVLGEFFKVAFTVSARKRLASLQLRAGLGVVGDQRPEILRRDISGEPEPVGIASTQVLAGGVSFGERILGADTDGFECHRRCVQRRLVEEKRSRIEVAPSATITVGME